jgi:hypothetical protein
MAIVAGFDVHRAQITFDALDTETGEVTRGRIDSAPAAVGRWVARFAVARLEFPRFRGHLIAGPSGPAARIDVHAVNPAVFA